MKTETRITKSIEAGEGDLTIRATVECDGDDHPERVDAVLPGGVTIQASAADLRRLVALIEKGTTMLYYCCPDHGQHEQYECPGCKVAESQAA